MIFNTFLLTLPSLGSIGLLLLLIQFIYTILGVEMFAMVKRGDNLTDDTNFENFKMSMMTLFRVSTGEGWNFVEDDMVRTNEAWYVCEKLTSYADWHAKGQIGCGTSAGYFYMISYQFVFAIIVINLFVAVILAGHEQTS